MVTETDNTNRRVYECEYEYECRWQKVSSCVGKEIQEILFDSTCLCVCVCVCVCVWGVGDGGIIDSGFGGMPMPCVSCCMYS
jgi:hypothetical protein